MVRAGAPVGPPPTALRLTPPDTAQRRVGRLPLVVGAVALIAVLGLTLAALRDRSQPNHGLRAGRPAPGLVRHEGVDRHTTSTAAALAAYEQASSAVLATGRTSGTD